MYRNIINLSNHFLQNNVKFPVVEVLPVSTFLGVTPSSSAMDTPVATTTTQEADPSSILVYKLDPQQPLPSLEQQAKSLAIPEVVVEYIKDSLKQGTDSGSPSFEGQELIVVRTPSSISLREDLPPQNGVTYLDAGGLTPRANSQLSLREYSSVPPSPNFGYRPLESETSAVYAIIRTSSTYNGEGGDKERELRMMEQLQARMEKEKATSRKFEHTPSAPAHLDLKRKNLQFMTDLISIILLIPGVLIAMLTPLFIIPMFLLPLKYYIPLIGLFGLSGSTAVALLCLSGVCGNIVWTVVDAEDGEQRVRPRLHCGTGPLRHFFGNGFYREYSDVLPQKA